ncbi:hypothetical protein ACTFIW_010340 [Dictyostelium discoideum]
MIEDSLSIIDSLKFQHLLIGKKSNDKPFIKIQDNYMKYIKEFDYELRHISGKKNEQINSQWLLEMKKNPNLCNEEINDICYLSVDGVHHALDITYNNTKQDKYFKEMFSISKRYIKSCSTCQLNIKLKDNGILQSLEIPYEVWRDIPTFPNRVKNETFFG